ncbi:SDR family NAD(P)-dependent oxidoreductase [Paracidovorax sp. MALMAid1276]|uniref:SDR family NAD(P)-dependent oxidoreductase n=1 Tax=Paracidovorax sp. MALMAid1276 TaxID=3411631 RepID=UPI003B99EA8A
MNSNKRIVIVGATSAIAEHCARLWLAQKPTELILVGRDTKRLDRIANDLRVRGPQSGTRIVITEFLNPQAINATVKDIVSLGRIDIVLIAHGSLPQQPECQHDLQACHDALALNGLSPVLFAEAFANEMEKVNHGTIALIGSVAGDRGRKSNYIYGAAKGLVTRYAQGLQHRFAGSGVKVVLIKPGPTDTPMTTHLKEKGAKLASVDSVAKQIFKGVESGTPVIYTPKKWQYIMMIIRHLPIMIFSKLDI